MSLHRCKFCKLDLPTYRDLHRHCEDLHPQEFLQVEQWLGKSVQPKVEQYQKLATEGLLGHRESRRD